MTPAEFVQACVNIINEHRFTDARVRTAREADVGALVSCLTDAEIEQIKLSPVTEILGNLPKSMCRIVAKVMHAEEKRRAQEDRRRRVLAPPEPVKMAWDFLMED